MSKLGDAFIGAIDEVTRPRNLIADGVIAGGVTALEVAFGVVAGAAFLPVALEGAACCAVVDVAVGAYKGLKYGYA